MGRWAKEFSEEDREKIQTLAGFGIPQTDIATVMGVTKMTLRKHCQKELDLGRTLATTKVAKSLFESALSGNTAAQIFWMKARAGWSEKTIIEGSVEWVVRLPQPIETSAEWEQQQRKRLSSG